MFSLNSSPVAFKGKLKVTTTYNILLVFFLFTLYITSCEARHIRFDGKYSNNDKSSLSSKDKTDIYDSKKQTRNSLMVHDAGKKAQVVGSSIGDQSGAGAASVDPSGGIRNTGYVTRVLLQLPHRKHRGDQGIHLDYAEPKTRTPYHN
ncbi:uncharacterized protein LOC124696659 [Lolium rigidum]|uniref:uncharacterized protein LOC124696659 n=1 Tax=Lolium rigidum TaxID=89674 RepID=UPI001F5C5145|nr:uncharacterized protein LOC124696659 [Lolium rigidum]